MSITSILAGFGFIEWLIVGFIAANSVLCGSYVLHRFMKRIGATRRTLASQVQPHGPSLSPNL